MIISHSVILTMVKCSDKKVRTKRFGQKFSDKKVWTKKFGQKCSDKKVSDKNVRTKKVRTKVVEEIKTHILYSVAFF
jgi:hypothetical protein